MNPHISKVTKYAPDIYKTIENIVITRGKGVFVYDKSNNKYMDCIAGYSALNQGHCHPKLIQAAKSQLESLTLTSRAYHNNKMGDFSEKLCKTFNYERVLLTNTGVEAGESAIKIARAWGYKYKKVPENEAISVFFNGNFWGRSLSACSSSDDPSCYENFGPYMPNFHLLDYSNIHQLHTFLIKYPTTVSVMLEPIQGEGGIRLPDPNYLYQVRELCTRHNVLMITDEVQTGLGRTGKLLASHHYKNVKPDMVCLGKALSGGMYPISAVLADSKIMDALTLGTHGSTFGGNPLACAIGTEALNIIEDEKLSERSEKMGKLFRDRMREIMKAQYETKQSTNKTTNKILKIKAIRGKGLLNAIEFHKKKDADQFIANLTENHVLAKTTRETVVRITPPLTITKTEMSMLLNTIEKSIQ